MVETPVLFITFVRPEYARRSWEAIKAAKPKTLYFYSNKGRAEKEGEIERNEEIRAYIKEIDWDCDLHTYFRDKCVDIYTSLWGAMDWLFDNEERGIVLEEDCVASLAFFTYCDRMLKLYKDDQRISIISGDNRTPQFNPKDMDCFLTKHVDIYGWASWADRWHSLDRNMKDWPKYRWKMFKYQDTIFSALWYILFWERMYRKINRFNPWDCISTYNRLKNGTFGLIPFCNLVEDIGTLGVHHAVSTKEVKGYDSHVRIIPKDYFRDFKYRPLHVDKNYDRKTSSIIINKEFKYQLSKISKKLGLG